jgi:hypothetical protein
MLHVSSYSLHIPKRLVLARAYLVKVTEKRAVSGHFQWKATIMILLNSQDDIPA